MHLTKKMFIIMINNKYNKLFLTATGIPHFIELCRHCVLFFPGLMHETGCSELVHWDDPEGWDGGSGWGTYVHSWLIHVNVWQNHYNIVK